MAPFGNVLTRLVPPVMAFITAGILYLVSTYSYLLYHSVAELFSVVVAFGIFLLAWHSRRFLDNNALLFIGIAYFFVGLLDVLHLLSYRGMGVFPGRDANLPTQLWTAARYLQTFALLIAPFFAARQLRAGLTFALHGLITAVLLLSLFAWGLFPDCYIEGSGLTGFKKASELLFVALLGGSLIHLRTKRRDFDPSVLKLLQASIVATMGAELFFIFYIDVYGLFNFAGHVLKIAAFYLMYRSILYTGLVRPYTLLFRRLKQSEETLRGERDRLKEYVDQIKVLSGLLPICAACKKVRDDKGYWSQVEIYIESRSNARFTHGICPDCCKRLYPELFEGKEIDPSLLT